MRSCADGLANGTSSPRAVDTANLRKRANAGTSAGAITILADPRTAIAKLEATSHACPVKFKLLCSLRRGKEKV